MIKSVINVIDDGVKAVGGFWDTRKALDCVYHSRIIKTDLQLMIASLHTHKRY